jgi:hypothetical protein
MRRSFLEVSKYGDSVVMEVIGWPHTTAVSHQQHSHVQLGKMNNHLGAGLIKKKFPHI